MDKNMMHLAKITLANLPAGSIAPSDDMIIKAMLSAVAKEQDMADQIMSSKGRHGGAMDKFSSVVSGLVYDAVNA